MYRSIAIALSLLLLAPAHAAAADDTAFDIPNRLKTYFEDMSVAKPFEVRTGESWEAHRRALREFVLDCAGLQPLPERVPLDVRMSEPLDHPWCTIHRVSYQLWPGVYSTGLLFMPKQLPEQPAPAMLCPHGHWGNGNAHPVVQSRCLNLARLGYITFSSTQNHFEDLYVGVSHQTLMIWTNMRALDYLESLPEVDKDRIGVAGASGGGLQTQMLLAVDPRVKAATIVGLTCDFRDIMFPDSSHCTCNHFPNVMRRTDHPEISTLGLPCPVQYLTMNDWTKQFEADNFPTIRQLYAAHGVEDHVFCRYFDTPHDYDGPKRELTYWWMDRWLRGSTAAEPTPEPDTVTFPVETIVNLAVAQPNDKGFGEIARIYRSARTIAQPQSSSPDDLEIHRQKMTEALRDLLGMHVVLPRRGEALTGELKTQDGVVIERLAFPSEGSVVVPAWVLRPEHAASQTLPLEIILDARGKDALVQQTDDDSPWMRARQGNLVVLPDLRTFGESFSTGAKDANAQTLAWQRNSIVWGRPVTGMAVTDLQAVIDGMANYTRDDVDVDVNVQHVKVVSSGSGDLAVAGLFAMILDPRIMEADLDFAGACYEKRNLMVVPRVLLYGDIPRWAALVADRQLQLKNVPPEAGQLQPQKTAVIDCTDLYHPHQDVGDNFDIIAAYALPEIDLRAVILDSTEKYRQPPEGPRDAGFIPVTQLNALFNRQVLCGVTPYTAMRSPDDKMLDAPAFEQAGVELILNTLRQSQQQMEIVSFGSARAVALAYNRDPDLLRRRVRRIHLCAGASSPDFLEWNVVLDPHAFVCLLRSDLPIAIYPCATQEGPFAYGPHNCFWKLNDLAFIHELDPGLRRYLAFAFGATNRVDFLRAIEEDPPEEAWPSICSRAHNVWETCVWMQVANRRLVQRADGSYRIIPANDVRPDDKVLPNELRPCRIAARDNGGFTFEPTDGPSNFWIYDRGDPVANEKALREALPALYRGFRTR